VAHSNETTANSYGIAPPRFRLPAATHIGSVHLQVSDLARSVTYYEQVLGLRVHSVAGGLVALGPLDDDGWCGCTRVGA